MRALITGTSKGIGGVTALKLANDAIARGGTAHIAAHELVKSDAHEEMLARIRETGAKVTAVYGDLSDPDAPARIGAEAADAMGGIDAVLSNAGITSPASLLEMELEQWDRLFSINTRASWLLGKAVHPALKESGGAFVIIASMSGMRPHRLMGAYSPSKAAVIMLGELMAQEWAVDGIRVNVVSPGMVRTPLTDYVYQNNEIADARAGLVPMGRVALPEDIANTVAFLVGPDNTYMTGQNLLVDGGFTNSIHGHVPGRPASGAGG